MSEPFVDPTYQAALDRFHGKTVPQDYNSNQLYDQLFNGNQEAIARSSLSLPSGYAWHNPPIGYSPSPTTAAPTGSQPYGSTSGYYGQGGEIHNFHIYPNNDGFFHKSLWLTGAIVAYLYFSGILQTLEIHPLLAAFYGFVAASMATMFESDSEFKKFGKFGALFLFFAALAVAVAVAYKPAWEKTGVIIGQVLLGLSLGILGCVIVGWLYKKIFTHIWITSALVIVVSFAIHPTWWRKTLLWLQAAMSGA